MFRFVYALFLGIMVVTFFGFTVYLAYPPSVHTPEPPPGLYDSCSVSAAVPRAACERRRQEARDDYQRARGDEKDRQRSYPRNVGLAFLVLALATMGASLFLSSQVPVIANGLLFGALLTLLIGIGFIIFAQNVVLSFLVVTVALLVVLGLGYLRFGRAGGSSDRNEPAFG